MQSMDIVLHTQTAFGADLSSQVIFIFGDSNTIVYINQVTVTVSKTKSKSLNVTKSSRKRVRQKGESR